MTDGTRECGLLIVGGGPAGMGAACSASMTGESVCVVDDNPALGGQIWRGEHKKPGTRDAEHWFGKLRQETLPVVLGARVFDHPAPGILMAETWEGMIELRYRKLIIATGARERFLPFPGWTLPNVLGAGGLQALVKSGLPIRGSSVIVAGSGPLLLAVAAYLRKQGARVSLIAEQASRTRLLRFAVRLGRQPRKAAQALALKLRLWGIPFRANCWPVAARGEGKVTSVVLRQGGRTFEQSCDYLACGFHLIPNVELAGLLGCKLSGGGVVIVDEYQETSVPGIYCAGEPTGIGGLELSLAEGRIAGFAAAGNHEEARKLFPLREVQRTFAHLLNDTFALRGELKDLAREDTIVCRCEDIPLGRMRAFDSWRSAKLLSRCGMGPCQGRICGPATEFLLGWGMTSVRPPIFPARLEGLARQGS